MARKTGSHSEITAPRVFAAAHRLFARHGFAAVSMRRIAAEVGMQAGALYLYTPDKQTLLYELMRRHMEELLAAWADEAPKGAATQRLQHFARFHLRFHLARPEAVVIAYMELRNLELANFAAIESLRRRYEDALNTILGDGQQSGEFDIADPRLTTMALIAMLTGVTTWFRDGGRLNQRQVEDIYAGMIVKAVQRPDSKAPPA